MKTIEIENSTFENLKKMAVPLEDTVDSVIKRLIGLHRELRDVKAKKPQTKQGSGINTELLKKCILYASYYLWRDRKDQSRETVLDVLTNVFVNNDGFISGNDCNEDSRGNLNWHVKAQLAASSMRKEWLMVESTRENNWSWALTEEGTNKIYNMSKSRSDKIKSILASEVDDYS
jgi:predicted CopG family antitoxin